MGCYSSEARPRARPQKGPNRVVDKPFLLSENVYPASRKEPSAPRDTGQSAGNLLSFQLLTMSIRENINDPVWVARNKEAWDALSNEEQQRIKAKYLTREGRNDLTRRLIGYPLSEQEQQEMMNTLSTEEGIRSDVCSLTNDGLEKPFDILKELVQDCDLIEATVKQEVLHLINQVETKR